MTVCDTLLAVFSCEKNLSKARAVSKHLRSIVGNGAQVLVFVGRGSGVPLNEGEVRLDCDDSYARLPAKTSRMFRYCIEHYRFRYLVKIDDDTLLLDWRKLKDAMCDGDYIGTLIWHTGNEHHFGRSDDRFNVAMPLSQAPLMQGPLYCLSYRAVELFCGIPHENIREAHEDAPFYEDVMVGRVLSQFGGLKWKHLTDLLRFDRKFPFAKNLAWWATTNLNLRQLEIGIRLLKWSRRLSHLAVFLLGDRVPTYLFTRALSARYVLHVERARVQVIENRLVRTFGSLIEGRVRVAVVDPASVSGLRDAMSVLGVLRLLGRLGKKNVHVSDLSPSGLSRLKRYQPDCIVVLGHEPSTYLELLFTEFPRHPVVLIVPSLGKGGSGQIERWSRVVTSRSAALSVLGSSAGVGGLARAGVHVVLSEDVRSLAPPPMVYAAAEVDLLAIESDPVRGGWLAPSSLPIGSGLAKALRVFERVLSAMAPKAGVSLGRLVYRVRAKRKMRHAARQVARGAHIFTDDLNTAFLAYSMSRNATFVDGDRSRGSDVLEQTLPGSSNILCAPSWDKAREAREARIDVYRRVKNLVAGL